MSASLLSRKLSLGVVFVLSTLAPRLCAQNTWYVDDDAASPGHGTWNDPYRSIQRAISSSSTGNGDTIRVRAGVYRERIDLMSRSVVLISESGAGQTIIDAGNNGSVFTIRSGLGWDHECRIEGFTLRNGSGRYNPARGDALGGGIYCINARLSVVGCTIAGNSTRVGGSDSELTGRGGGIFGGNNAELILQACTISDNDAVTGGGVYLDRASLTMAGGSVLANRAMGRDDPGRGGGILAEAGSSLDLSGVDIEENLALGSNFAQEALGGGIRLEAGAAGHIQGCTIARNDSGGFSLGYGDLPGYGGGVSSMASASDFTMSSTIVRDNWGNSGGGGVQGKGVLDSCTIEGNRGQFGGGVAAIHMTLLNCILRDNRGSVSGSYDWGGGIFVGPGQFGRLENCDLGSNHAFGQGGGGWGGIYVDCDIHDNLAWADGTAGFVAGGGVFGGDLVGCHLWNNSSHEIDFQSAEGGGLFGGHARLCVLHDNDADSGGAAMSAQLERCTVVSNESTFSTAGGAALCAINDSIIRFNTPSDLFLCPSVIWSNVPLGTLGIGNIFGDPLLWDVGAHDYRLLPGSPCIDAGNPTSPPDPDGSRADMGAIPFSW